MGSRLRNDRNISLHRKLVQKIHCNAKGFVRSCNEKRPFRLLDTFGHLLRQLADLIAMSMMRWSARSNLFHVSLSLPLPDFFAGLQGFAEGGVQMNRSARVPAQCHRLVCKQGQAPVILLGVNRFTQLMKHDNSVTEQFDLVDRLGTACAAEMRGPVGRDDQQGHTGFSRFDDCRMVVRHGGTGCTDQQSRYTGRLTGSESLESG